MALAYTHGGPLVSRPDRVWTDRSRPYPSKPAIVWFTVPSEPGDPGPHFARRLGKDYWAANRWRGWRLCGAFAGLLTAALGPPWWLVRRASGFGWWRHVPRVLRQPARAGHAAGRYV